MPQRAWQACFGSTTLLSPNTVAEMSKKVLFAVLIVAAAIGFGGWKLVTPLKKASHLGGETMAHCHLLYHAGADADIHGEGAVRFRGAVKQEEGSQFSDLVRNKPGVHQGGVMKVNDPNGDQPLLLWFAIHRHWSSRSSASHAA
jgi:hypothetical protein